MLGLLKALRHRGKALSVGEIDEDKPACLEKEYSLEFA